MFKDLGILILYGLLDVLRWCVSIVLAYVIYHMTFLGPLVEALKNLYRMKGETIHIIQFIEMIGTLSLLVLSFYLIYKVVNLFVETFWNMIFNSEKIMRDAYGRLMGGEYEE